MTALVLCLWTTSFTLIANFAPSGATVSRYYCEVDSASLLQEVVGEVNNLTTNTTRENSAVIKLIDDIELTDGDVTFNPLAIFDNMGEKEIEEFNNNPRPIVFATLDLNGHVLTLSEGGFGVGSWFHLEIIDSNPTVENVLPNGETITGGAVYGVDAGTSFTLYYGYTTINGGNFCGNCAFYVLGDLTINQGVIKCYIQTDEIEIVPTGIIITKVPDVYGMNSNLYINGGQIDYPVVVIDADSGEVITDPEIIAEYVTIDESKVNVIKDDAGNIIGYAEKVNEPEPTPTPEDPENPEDPNEQDPTEEQKPSDNKTPVISGTTDNGQPTSDDFMKIMMIGILVIVALSVISIAASLLIIKKYRPRVA